MSSKDTVISVRGLSKSYTIAHGALGRPSFREVLMEHPTVLLGLAQELAGDVRRLTGRAADHVFLDLRRRLAKLLLEETSSGGTPTVDLGLTQSGIAARVGTTRQSLNRAMSELARRSWIESQGPTVRILDRAALEHFAGS